MTTYSIKQLANGLKVALLPAKSKVFYCGFAIHSGSINDPTHLHGLAHFVEHTIFKGTEKRKSWHIINRMERVGGELNAFTTKETTFIYTAAPRSEISRSMELLNDLIRHAIFPSRELEKEKQVVEEEIKIYKDTPSEIIFDHFDQLFFQDESLAHPILGDKKSLSRMSQDDCIQYARETFTPDRLLFFSMGQITPTRFEQLTQQLLGEPFASINKSSPPHLTYSTNHFEKQQAISTHQAHTLIGGVAPTLHDDKRTEASLLMNILAGNGMNTKLNIQLREQRGWVYNVEASYTALSHIGWWQIYFGSDPLNAEKALTATLKELKKLQDTPLTSTTLRAWIKQAKGEATMSTEQSETVFLNFGRQLLLKGHYDSLPHYFYRLEQVTPRSLQEVANQLFAHNNISKLIYNSLK